MAVNYVKFQRGSQAAYDRLLELNRIDNDTLYFIYGENSGKLYLGNRLISSDNGSVVEALSLSDLTDVIVSEVKTNSFLVQDENGKWNNLALEEVIELISNGINFELSAQGDDVIDAEITDNLLSITHKKIGPEGGAHKGPNADVSIENFGDSIEIKIPVVKVDEYGHTTLLDEQVLSVSIPQLPEFVDTDTQYELKYETNESGAQVIRLYDNFGSIVSTIDATEFIKDGMLEEVSYDENTNKLTFVWNTAAGITSSVITLTDILDPYVAGNGIQISGNEIAIKLAPNEVNLAVDENGLKTVFDLNDKVDKVYEFTPVIDLDSGRTVTQEEFESNNYFILTDNGYVVANEYNEETIYYTQAIDDDGSYVYDKIPYELISPYDKQKLDKLVFDEDGGVSVSGNINITQVQGLNGYLREEHLSAPVVEKLNYITDVNSKYFSVSEARKLEFEFIKDIDENVFKIADVNTGLVDENGENIINKKVLQLKNVPAEALTATIGNLSAVPTVTLSDGSESNTLVDNINNIYSILTWGDMT